MAVNCCFCGCVSDQKAFQRQVVQGAHTASPCLQESHDLAFDVVLSGQPAAEAYIIFLLQNSHPIRSR